MKVSLKIIAAAAASLCAVSVASAAEETSQQCYKNAQNRVDTIRCMELELQEVRKVYDGVVERVADNARELDRIQRKKLALPAFEEANRAFAGYVKQECEWVEQSYGSGSGAGNASQACRINLYRIRASSLETQFLGK